MLVLFGQGGPSPRQRDHSEYSSSYRNKAIIRFDESDHAIKASNGDYIGSVKAELSIYNGCERVEPKQSLACFILRLCRPKVAMTSSRGCINDLVKYCMCVGACNADSCEITLSNKLIVLTGRPFYPDRVSILRRVLSSTPREILTLI
jgi:hypothetical protein